MDLKFALLADHVNQTRTGKLNIIGEFNVLWAQKAPASHPVIYLVARFEASVSEGTHHRLEIGLYDEDGGVVLPKSPQFPLEFQPQGPGLPLRGQVVAQLGALKFPTFGRYEFHLLVDGRQEGSVPVALREAKVKKKGGKG